jgi:hypothetical protein
MFGINWKGKVGGIIVGLVGIAKLVKPEITEALDSVIEGLVLLGSGLGIFGIREAMGSRRAVISGEAVAPDRSVG